MTEEKRRIRRTENPRREKPRGNRSLRYEPRMRVDLLFGNSCESGKRYDPPPTGGDPAASLMSAGTDHGIRHGDHPLSSFMDIDAQIVPAVSSIVHRTKSWIGMDPEPARESCDPKLSSRAEKTEKGNLASIRHRGHSKGGH